MRYLKVFGLEWLEGSIRVDLDSAGRGMWADILALGSISRRIGYLERSIGIPYTEQELADKFKVGIGELQNVIATCILEGRLARDPETDTLYITNWNNYQDYPLGSRPTKKVDKTEANNKIPLSPEDREASQQAAAARLAYLQPEAAKRGMSNRKHEDIIKKRNKRVINENDKTG